MKKITTLCLLTCLTVTLNSTCMLRQISKIRPSLHNRSRGLRLYNCGTPGPNNAQLLAAIQENNALLNKIYAEMQKQQKLTLPNSQQPEQRSISESFSHDFRDKHHGAYSENK